MVMGVVLLSVGIADCSANTQHVCVGPLDCSNNDGVVYGPCTSSDQSGPCASNCFGNNTSIYTYGYTEGVPYCNSVCNYDHSSHCCAAYSTCYGGYTAMIVFGAIIMALACCCGCCGGCLFNRVKSYSKRMTGTIPCNVPYTMEVPVVVVSPPQDIVMVEATPINDKSPAYHV